MLLSISLPLSTIHWIINGTSNGLDWVLQRRDNNQDEDIRTGEECVLRWSDHTVQLWSGCTGSSVGPGPLVSGWWRESWVSLTPSRLAGMITDHVTIWDYLDIGLVLSKTSSRVPVERFEIPQLGLMLQQI